MPKKERTYHTIPKAIASLERKGVIFEGRMMDISHAKNLGIKS